MNKPTIKDIKLDYGYEKQEYDPLEKNIKRQEKSD